MTKEQVSTLLLSPYTLLCNESRSRDQAAMWYVLNIMIMMAVLMFCNTSCKVKVVEGGKTEDVPILLL